LIDDLFQQFLGMVTNRRALSPEALREVAQGGVFTGRRGLDLGLVDAIGGEDEAREWLASEHNIALSSPLRDQSLREPGEWWERVADRIENQTRLGATPVLDGPWAVWHY
jgi:protease-4